MVFGRTHPCFYLTVWFQRERFEALLVVITMEHAFSFHGAGGECHGRWDLRLTMVVCVFVAMKNWLSDRVLEQRFVSGGDCTREAQSLMPQGEDPRSGLNWLCLAMNLLEALF